jgi:hypothetical protein
MKLIFGVEFHHCLSEGCWEFAFGGKVVETGVWAAFMGEKGG